MNWAIVESNAFLSRLRRLIAWTWAALVIASKIQIALSVSCKDWNLILRNWGQTVFVAWLSHHLIVLIAWISRDQSSIV
jgi:hypothetical protein